MNLVYCAQCLAWKFNLLEGGPCSMGEKCDQHAYRQRAGLHNPSTIILGKMSTLHPSWFFA